ncbi:MAG: hypothetical protein RLZZ597_3049 [Cyanobacteriota bacterium]|jgi:hypothetical protein
MPIRPNAPYRWPLWILSLTILTLLGVAYAYGLHPAGLA